MGTRMIIVISRSLLAQQKFPLALESLATLFAVAGGIVDRVGWSHYKDLEQIFVEVQHLVSGDGPDVLLSQTQRALESLLHLRAGGWRDEDVNRALNSEWN